MANWYKENSPPPRTTPEEFSLVGTRTLMRCTALPLRHPIRFSLSSLSQTVHTTAAADAAAAIYADNVHTRSTVMMPLLFLLTAHL